MAPPKKQNLCPQCYLQDGIDEPLIYNLGSTQPLRCNRNHVYEDREELSVLTKQMIDQKRALSPKVDIPPPVIDDTPLAPPPDTDVTDPISTAGTKPMWINAIDVVRLKTILGEFNSSNLFGTVFALNQELKDTKELLHRLEGSKKKSSTESGPGTENPGGDVVVPLVVPERHVQATKDIAEANGMDIVQYLNAKIEDAFDAMWFF